jgi:hypothetical protein
MRTVSHQGKTLSASQRRHLDLQRIMRASSDTSVLQAQVNETLSALEQRKEQGAKPYKPTVLISSESGTVSIAEWMGY